MIDAATKPADLTEALVSPKVGETGRKYRFPDDL